MVNKGIQESKYGYKYLELDFYNWRELRDHLISWEDINGQDIFLFRGHSNSSWELEPTIERIRPDLEKPFCEHNGHIAAEKYSIQNYKRAIRLFLTDKENRFISNDLTPLEWLSIMQHHGAGTRLLDATYSPWIAAFFASADVSCITQKDKEEKRCIWAFPLKIIDAKNIGPKNTKNRSGIELYDYYQTLGVMGQSDEPIIGYTFLNKLSERPFHQLSALLYSMSSTICFSKLLKEYYDDRDCNIQLTKLTFRFSDRSDFAKAINDLKLMNICYSSLFPGIDGYSKDIFLRQHIENSVQSNLS